MRGLMIWVAAVALVINASIVQAAILDPGVFLTPVRVNRVGTSYENNHFVTQDGQTLVFKADFEPHQVWSENWGQVVPNGRKMFVNPINVSPQLGQSWMDDPSITADN